MSEVNFAGIDVGAAATEEGVRSGCEESRHLIELGDYEQACEVLAPFWPGLGSEPELRGLSPETGAELLLAVGVAAGFAGKARGAAGAQEFAKDMIGRALRHFAERGMAERSADAQICLAVCYWREGAYDEARLLLGAVLETLSPAEQTLRLRALLWLAVVEKMAARYAEALLVYERAAPLVEASGDVMRRGSFHSDRGQALLHLGEASGDARVLARAAEDFRAAHDFYSRAGHLRYAGAVQNNLGYLLNVLGRPAEAHEALDRAREIFAALGEINMLASVEDTRARVLLGEGRHGEAVEASARAVGALEGGDAYGLLCEALTTHATALARAGHRADALAAFARAEQLADERVGGGAGERIALTMIEELAARLCARAGVGFNEAVHRFEGGIIREALAAAGGRLTVAAARLGLKHQTLAAMLNSRHAKLLPQRTEIRPRRRSLIRVRGGRGKAECRVRAGDERDAAPDFELETERLLLRRFLPSDLAALSRLFGDAEVTRYLGREPGRTMPAAEVETLLALLTTEWERHGFGRFAVIDKATGAFVGLCGWKRLEGAADMPELLYVFGKEHWGRGLASEAAAACLRHGFAELGMQRVVALTRPEHAVSRRVLDRIGMRCEGEGTHYGVRVVRYSATCDEFRSGPD